MGGSRMGKAARGPVAGGRTRATRRQHASRAEGRRAGASPSSESDGGASSSCCSGRAGGAVVDFSLLAMSTLKRYKRAHRLRTRPASNKAELVVAVAKHFAEAAPLPDEAAIIESFASAIIRNSQGMALLFIARVACDCSCGLCCGACSPCALVEREEHGSGGRAMQQ